MSRLEKIKEKVLVRDYYLSYRAEDEMFDDNLDRHDVENAVLCGDIAKIMTRDVRGSRYKIKGPAKDGRIIQLICSYKDNKSLTILIVFTLTEDL